MIEIQSHRLPEEVVQLGVERALLRVGLVGLVGLTRVELLLAASVAHVWPQYGCTLVPSLNFDLRLHCYGSEFR